MALRIDEPNCGPERKPAVARIEDLSQELGPAGDMPTVKGTIVSSDHESRATTARLLRASYTWRQLRLDLCQCSVTCPLGGNCGLEQDDSAPGCHGVPDTQMTAWKLMIAIWARASIIRA